MVSLSKLKDTRNKGFNWDSSEKRMRSKCWCCFQNCFERHPESRFQLRREVLVSTGSPPPLWGGEPSLGEEGTKSWCRFPRKLLSPVSFPTEQLFHFAVDKLKSHVYFVVQFLSLKMVEEFEGIAGRIKSQGCRYNWCFEANQCI